MKRRKTLFLLVLLVLILAGIVFLGWMRWTAFLYPLEYEHDVRHYCTEYELDPYLVFALIRQESAFRADAQSPVGAWGLMQLMPETAEWAAGQLGLPYEIDSLSDAEYNINLGCWYLSYLSKQFGSEWLALAAYNAGQGVVQQWLDDDIWSGSMEDVEDVPYAETRNYLLRIEHFYQRYQKLYGK